MEVAEIISIAFVMGLAGSLHCIGMCGPIAMALPLGNKSNRERLLGGTLYNLGRVLTYTWLGLVLGLAGGFLITPKVQSSLSFLFGAAILLSLVVPKHLTKSISQISPTQNLFLRLRNGLGKLLSLQTHSSYLGIGMLNGLLPCGMIYLALASSFLSGSVLNGALFMASFGAGTFPVMLAVVYFRSLIKQEVRLSLRKAVPFFLACMAALLMLRGLNLGIPYLSPALPVDRENTAVICH